MARFVPIKLSNVKGRHLVTRTLAHLLAWLAPHCAVMECRSKQRVNSQTLRDSFSAWFFKRQRIFVVDLPYDPDPRSAPYFNPTCAPS